MSDFFVAAPQEHQKKEKAKARELRKSLWWRQTLGKGVCYHCGGRFKPEELTMDHLTPIARGGVSSKKNCVPSCKDCNSKKGYKMSVELTLEEMARQKDFPSDGASKNLEQRSLESSESDPSEENE